jgi:hypothetical protein
VRPQAAAAVDPRGTLDFDAIDIKLLENHHARNHRNHWQGRRRTCAHRLAERLPVRAVLRDEVKAADWRTRGCDVGSFRKRRQYRVRPAALQHL